MARTTLALQVLTRDRITASAQSESLTIDAFLTRLLDEREERAFWASLDQLTPETYAVAIGDDGDGLDEGYAREDAFLDAE